MNLTKLTGIDDIETVLSRLANFLIEDFLNSKTITFKELRKLTDDRSYEFINWLLKAKPQDLGTAMPFYGVEEPPASLKFHVFKRRRSITRFDGSPKTYVEKNYVPLPVWRKYCQMKEDLEKNKDLELVAVSGYRSPAYQCLLMAYLLFRNLDDTERILRTVALPGYSQHGLFEKTALDIDTPERTTDPDNDLDFAKTDQYIWLIESASNYGFYLSYPKNNDYKVDFEPWHWQYLGAKTD